MMRRAIALLVVLAGVYAGRAESGASTPPPAAAVETESGRHAPAQRGAHCGNWQCEPPEDCNTCPHDCGQCPGGNGRH